MMSEFVLSSSGSVSLFVSQRAAGERNLIETSLGALFWRVTNPARSHRHNTVAACLILPDWTGGGRCEDVGSSPGPCAAC
jgi:hypothetical protein